jgi:predicted enzyme related to lactoylglutathione lyase
MDQKRGLYREDTIVFEYDVHDMERALRWYQAMFGFKIAYGPTHCHNELALPVSGARLALSLADSKVKIRKASRVFLVTDDIYAVEADLKNKGATTKPIENTDDVVLILWVVDPDGNHLAIKQRLIEQCYNEHSLRTS